MVFTEGTDIPRVETVIIARPTQSDGLYTQMVGRGLRLYPGKQRLTLIDCVGATGKASLCTAPTLLGIDLTDVPPKRLQDVQGLLFELPDKAERAADCPQSWIRNITTVDLWAKAQKYTTHGVNYFRMPDGRMVCSLLKGQCIVIPKADELGNVHFGGQYMPMQEALDRTYTHLKEAYPDQEYLWNVERVKRWRNAPATEKQMQLIRRIAKGRYELPDEMNKLEASLVLSRLLNRR